MSNELADPPELLREYTLKPEEFQTAAKAVNDMAVLRGNLQFFMNHIINANKLKGNWTLSEDSSRLVLVIT